MSIYKVVLSVTVLAAAVCFFSYSNDSEDKVASHESKAVFLAGNDG